MTKFLKNSKWPGSFMVILFLLLWPFTVRSQPNTKIYTSPVLHLFYSSACAPCHQALIELSKVKKAIPELKVVYHNLIYPQNVKLLRKFCIYYRVPSQYTMVFPVAFIGNQYLRESQLSKEYIVAIVKSLQIAAITTPNIKDVHTLNHNDEKRLSNIKIIPVIIAGLIDGINPCAFLTLTFLMSLLYTQKASRKRIMIIALFYSTAVFLTYLAAGLGLSTFIGTMEHYAWLLEVLQLLIGIIAILFGLTSFRDFLLMQRGEYHEVTLKLPDKVKELIRITLKKGVSSFWVPLGAVGAGVIVSVLEFMCTAQVYLPTLMYMHTLTTLRFKAFLLLVAYNLAFIVPLLIVFIITLIGSSSSHLLKFGNRLYPIAKIALSIVFLVLGIYLIDSVARLIF